MQPSLLDRADLAVVRGTAAALGGGPWESVIACLLAPGVVQHSPTDPEWSDRDRLVVGEEAAAGPLDTGLVAAGHAPGRAWFDATGGCALALSRGMASASDLDGGVFRVWCLLGEAALRAGDTWEAAVGAPSGSLVVVAAVPSQVAAAVGAWMAEAGWRVCQARADEPAEVLGGLDHALLPGGPGVLVAAWGEP